MFVDNFEIFILTNEMFFENFNTFFPSQICYYLKRIIIFEIFNISENNIIGVVTAKVVVVVVVVIVIVVEYIVASFMTSVFLVKFGRKRCHEAYLLQ
jgi:hypothetical protein